MSFAKRWTAAEAERRERVRDLGCLACRSNEEVGDYLPCPMRVTIDHANLGGIAGQKVLGNHAITPLCEWHHQGVQLQGMTGRGMAQCYGPSLAKGSKTYRARYGDDSTMLARVAEMLGETQ
jgi:hypothetical protein